MGLTLTVFFEDPYWVGIFQRSGEGTRALARVVFGAEPSAAEVHEFVLRRLGSLEFEPVATTSDSPRQVSPKRRQREAARAVEHVGARTRAQEALRIALEARKEERKAVTRAERRATAERRFALRRARRKKRHRGR